MGLAISIIAWILEVFSILVIVHVLMMWAVSLKVISLKNPFVGRVMEILMKTVEPMLEKIRLLLPPTLPIDLSPLILIVAIQIVKRILIAVF